MQHNTALTSSYAGLYCASSNEIVSMSALNMAIHAVESACSKRVPGGRPSSVERSNSEMLSKPRNLHTTACECVVYSWYNDDTTQTERNAREPQRQSSTIMRCV